LTQSDKIHKNAGKDVKKIKLDEIQRREEAYITKLWNEAMKIRQDWYDIDREDEENIDAITEDENFENNKNRY
jgi:hypothetical protein